MPFTARLSEILKTEMSIHPITTLSVILSRAKDPSVECYLRRSLGSFARLRMTPADLFLSEIQDPRFQMPDFTISSLRISPSA
jgi:hypothetical protein